MRNTPTFDVEKARLANYVHHYECYMLACAFTEDECNLLIQLARQVKPATLNLAGKTERSAEDWQAVENLGIRYKVEGWFINPYYLTPAGWEAFQEEWKALP